MQATSTVFLDALKAHFCTVCFLCILNFILAVEAANVPFIKMVKQMILSRSISRPLMTSLSLSPSSYLSLPHPQPRWEVLRRLRPSAGEHSAAAQRLGLSAGREATAALKHTTTTTTHKPTNRPTSQTTEPPAGSTNVSQARRSNTAVTLLPFAQALNNHLGATN